MLNTKKRLVHSYFSKEVIPEMYQMCNVFYIFDVLKIVCDNLYKSQAISYPKQIKNTNIPPPVPPLIWSNIVNDPIDEKIHKCYDYMRQHMFIQNNALFVSLIFNKEPISLLICTTESQENCFKVNLRLNDIWYNNSVLEGQWALYQAFYKPPEWSNVSLYLHNIMPTGPQIVIENDLVQKPNCENNDENRSSDEESSIANQDEVDEEIEKEVDKEVEKEVDKEVVDKGIDADIVGTDDKTNIESEKKKIKLDLTQKNAIKTLPDQQNRLLRCNFYIRNIWILAGQFFTKDSPDQYAYQFSYLNQCLNTNNYIFDTNISSINLINSLSGVYSHQYKQDTVSFKLALYKSIPYHILDKKIIKHFNAIPTLSSMFNFTNTIHAFVTYLGSHKPGVYVLSGMAAGHIDKENKIKEDQSNVIDKYVPNECGLNLVSFDVAFIPTLEVQQYIVHLIKTRGTKKPVIMQCVYCPSKRKWTPILFAGNRKEPDLVSYIKSKYK
jgi:hypothetical protein